MGAFRIDVEVCRPGRRSRRLAVPRVLVDTGAELSWLPEGVLRAIGVEILKPGERFVTADGREIRRDVAIAVLRAGGFTTVDEVVLARPGDLSLLGARTIEGFNAVVDLRHKRLVAAGPMPAAAA